mmetsp:Transcript_47809/g.128976  ORF Transcript_47809/g.128976 Transcript_47809/m.128976 type:complete len:203 (+) Transcript_47809:1564-2172(+)
MRPQSGQACCRRRPRRHGRRGCRRRGPERPTAQPPGGGASPAPGDACSAPRRCRLAAALLGSLAPLPRAHLPGRAPRPQGSRGPLLLPVRLGAQAPRGGPSRRRRRRHTPGGLRCGQALGCCPERALQEHGLVAALWQHGGAPAPLARVGARGAAEVEQLRGRAPRGGRGGARGPALPGLGAAPLAVSGHGTGAEHAGVLLF